MLYRLCAVALVLVAASARAEDKNLAATLKAGTVELKSTGPLAFGPQGILFVGDPAAATIYAIDTNDREMPAAKDGPTVEGITDKVASLLGTEAKGIQIKDLAVNPLSHTTYLAVARGTGPTAPTVLVKVTPGGALSEFALKDVKFAKAEIPNAATGRSQQDVITHLAYYKGQVMVAGMSNEKFASKLRSIPFPFDKTDAGTSVEIYHGAHGAWETRSPVRVFAPYKIGDEDYLLAAYQCTPLVKLPVAGLKPGEKLVGTTIAELGNRNRPLSMIVYQKGGKDYVLMANNARGLMKIPLAGIDKIEGIKDRVADKAGVEYETVKGKEGVQKLDAFDKDRAVVLVVTKAGSRLETMELP